MKIIVSSKVLTSVLNYIFNFTNNVSKWKITDKGLEFYSSYLKKWIVMSCHEQSTSNSGIDENDLNVEFTFNPTQWNLIFDFARLHLKEQPVTMHFAGSAEEILNGDDEIKITGVEASFRK